MQVPSQSTPKRDVYQQITDQIVAAIEHGAGPTELPWHRTDAATTRPTNALTDDAYQGINIVSLWAAAATKEFTVGNWATFKQWRQLGAHVRKGEKGSPIVFYKRFGEDQTNARGEAADIDNGTNDGSPRLRWFARTSWVFNAAQVDGWAPPAPVIHDPAQIIGRAERFISATGAVIRHGAIEACYRPADDIIQMPARETFKGTSTRSATEGFYAVLFHELTHWSGNPKRLDRDMSGRFGAAAYAMEELVAELGASFLCADWAITNQPRPDHASYITSWLKILKGDPRAIFVASRHASEAAKYLIGLQAGDCKAAKPPLEEVAL